MVNARVLLVEDDADMIEVVRVALEGSGCAVTAAMNGRDGLERLERHARPDLVVLDLWLPGVTGEMLLHRIRGDPALRAIPVVVVTGAPVPPWVMQAADAVLRKPFDLDHFLATVERLAGTEREHPTPPPLA